uniref:Motilin/ghrelin-associated peptide domain-containing protein n=1 Tax=Phasianus colchicus TaxID=9054 RepID=A0A669QI76_PHACC
AQTMMHFLCPVEKERIKGQKKSLTSLQQLEEEGFSEQSGADNEGMKTIQLAVPVRAGMWLILRQLEKYQGVLEKLLTEVLQDTPNGTGRGLISALGILPFSPLTSSSSWRYLYSSEGLLCHVCSLYRVLSYPTLSHVHTFLLGRLYSLLESCLCPRADVDCWQQCNNFQQHCFLPPHSSFSKVLSL